MSLYSRLDRIAADVARLDRQLTSVSNHPQSQRTSVEGGSIDFNDDDGNLMAIVGSQDDGGNTINVLSGPTPPTPVGFTVDVDHGKFIVHWSGDFEGDALAPSDWSRAEVHASQDPFFVPSRATARGSIVSAAGGEVTIGVLKGPWTIKMLAWSQAGKMSAPSAPADVEVPGYGEIVLEEIDAANTEIKNGNSILVNAQDTLGGKLDSAFGQLDGINDDLSNLDDAVQGAIASANGKNTVHFDDRAPTAADEGVAGDTWFVGQVGRPNDVVEATNLAPNPSFELGTDQPGWASRADAGANIETSTEWSESGSKSLKVTGNGGHTASSAYYLIDRTASVLSPGKTYTISATARLSGPLAGTLSNNSRRIVFGTRNASTGAYAYSVSESTPAPNVAGTTRLSHTFTVPAGFYGFIRLMNGSSSSSMWWDDIDLAEVSEPRPYFDGDVPDGATDNDPHYRWTGTPHASTSEKYLPATDGLSDKWNVTAQYRHDGTGWVQVELSHDVISSVDIGALTVGSAAIKEAVVERLFADVVVSRMSVADEFIGENAILTGAVTAPKITASEELWAKLGQFVKIRSEQLESDAIDSMVITSPTIQSARSGRRWVAGPDSIRVINENDDVRTELSPDGSTFKGEVEAETLVVNEGAEFKANNTLAQGAHLLLAAGVTDPTAPPVVQPFWGSLELSQSMDDVVGLAWDGANYITAERNKMGPNVSSQWKNIYGYKINGSTGAVTELRCDFNSVPDPDGRVSEVFGVTCIGNELFWYGRYGYKGYVWVTDLSGTFKRQFASPDIGYSATNPLAYRPCIGTDGTNLVVAGCSDAGRFNFQTVNKTTGTSSGLVSGPDEKYKSDTTGVYIGAADDGATRVYVQPGRVSHVSAYTTSGAIDSARRFDMATSDSVGVVYADGKFHTLDPSGRIHEYADNNTGDGSGDWWACYAWGEDFDNNGIVETWSRPSPPVRFTWPRRTKLKFLGQPLPDGAQMLLPAIAKKASKPVRTDFHSPSWNFVDGKSESYYDELPTDWETYPSPRDSNNFPEAESSVIESASGTYLVRGDGSGHWGPLTMGHNGVMSGLVVSGEVRITQVANQVSQVTVSLPAGRFTKPPRIWVQPSTTVPQKMAASVLDSATTATSFTLYFWRDTATETGVLWFAMDSE